MTQKQEELIEYIVKNNDRRFNLLKAAEEMQELSLALIQKMTKEDKYDDNKIIDEIGDVEIRLAILKKIFPLEKIEKRVDYKLSKYQEYKDSKAYKNI